MPEVVQDFGGTLLGYGNHRRVFPQLGDCAAIDGALKQVLEYTLQLLSTVPKGPPTDVVWAWRLIHFGPLEGANHFPSVDKDVTVIRFE